MELIREAEWIITCFLKRVVCNRLLWSGLFIGYVYNLNKAAEFCHAAPGDDAGQVPGGLQTPPPPDAPQALPAPPWVQQQHIPKQVTSLRTWSISLLAVMLVK